MFLFWFLIFHPLEFFANSFWIKIPFLFVIFILHLGEPQTTCLCLKVKTHPNVQEAGLMLSKNNIPAISLGKIFTFMI